MFGAFRAQREMLCEEPDIITVEFAVNDTTSPDVVPGYEALVRQCVASAKKPLVILLFTMRRDGMNLQDRHIPVGRHYGLPMLSYRDALYPEIAAGKLAWETISPDEVHPNDLGHAFLAAMLRSPGDTGSESVCRPFAGMRACTPPPGPTALHGRRMRSHPPLRIFPSARR